MNQRVHRVVHIRGSTPESVFGRVWGLCATVRPQCALPRALSCPRQCPAHGCGSQRCLPTPRTHRCLLPWAHGEDLAQEVFQKACHRTQEGEPRCRERRTGPSLPPGWWQVGNAPGFPVAVTWGGRVISSSLGWLDTEASLERIPTVTVAWVLRRAEGKLDLCGRWPPLAVLSELPLIRPEIAKDLGHGCEAAVAENRKRKEDLPWVSSFASLGHSGLPSGASPAQQGWLACRREGRLSMSEEDPEVTVPSPAPSGEIRDSPARR